MNLLFACCNYSFLEHAGEGRGEVFFFFALARAGRGWITRSFERLHLLMASCYYSLLLVDNEMGWACWQKSPSEKRAKSPCWSRHGSISSSVRCLEVAGLGNSVTWRPAAVSAPKSVCQVCFLFIWYWGFNTFVVWVLSWHCPASAVERKILLVQWLPSSGITRGGWTIWACFN